MTNLDPYLAVYFITFVVLILLEVPIAYAMLASAFEFIVPIIPPSINFVVWAFLSQTSTLAMFQAGMDRVS